MIGFYKGPPSHHSVKLVRGEVVEEGRGISFFYLRPWTDVLSVPVTCTDMSFSIRENTSDYQPVRIRGTITYRIVDPRKASSLLDYSVDPRTGKYNSRDPYKLPCRVVACAKSAIREEVKRITVRQAMIGHGEIARGAMAKMDRSKDLASLGVSATALYIDAVEARAEVERAIEAEFREMIVSMARNSGLSMQHRQGTAPGPDPTSHDLPAIECTWSCPFRTFCDDFQKTVAGGRAWCTLFREFDR